MSHQETVTWKRTLTGQIAPDLEQEIDVFETQLELRRIGKLDEKLFAETRLRRGVYGQRYDNGQRHDGAASQTLGYPSGDLTKGPNTMWDAPGMLRIKIPFGALDAEQLELLADLAEEYSDSICHITTRQDVQLHFIHIDDAPDIMRRLGAVGITTQEACGNSVRNVTACPLSGVCQDEAFDVTPYARALAFFLLGHPDAQDFGRKFKIAFSGCEDHPCGLTNMHDLGFVATHHEIDGVSRRGFRITVGGGLGAVPHQAKVLREFAAEEDALPLAQAACRVFARLGEKRNRARARIKFLVAKLGIEEFQRLVEEELKIIPADERWTAYLTELDATNETPLLAGSVAPTSVKSKHLERWLATNVRAQRQEGYYVATVHLPLGDLTSQQTRELADIARRYNGGLTRATVEQNLVLRHVPGASLADLYRDLENGGLADSGAGTLVDITACPGTDTCKLGISSSRGLAGELRKRIAAKAYELDEVVEGLRIKISGCFNSCAQHHIADIGFYGVSRKKDGRTVPHFQVVLGGKSKQNAGSYGLAVVAVPSKRIPEVVERITDLFVRQREAKESFQDFVERTGKARIRELLDDLTTLPNYNEETMLFSDWGDPREYTIGDMGVGECAGEVVPLVQFGLAASERRVFEAQLELDRGDHSLAAGTAYKAMVEAARALVRVQFLDVPDVADEVVREFRERFFDTQVFFDPYAGGKFGNYLFRAHANGRAHNVEDAHRRIEEAQLFIEAAHACYGRMTDTTAA